MKNQKVRFIPAELIIGALGLTEQLGTGHYHWASIFPNFSRLTEKVIYQN